MLHKWFTHFFDIDLSRSLRLLLLLLHLASIHQLTFLALSSCCWCFFFYFLGEISRAIGNLINRRSFARSPRLDSSIAFCAAPRRIFITPTARVLIDMLLTYRWCSSCEMFFVRISHYFMQFKISSRKCLSISSSCRCTVAALFISTQCQKLKSRWKIHNNLTLCANKENKCIWIAFMRCVHIRNI